MRKWVIFKGWHFSLSNLWQRFIPRIGSGPVTYDFKFPKENWFEYSGKEDLDINKLCGFGYGVHMTNSVRVGWIPHFQKEGSFILYFYIYNAGIRTIKSFHIITADTNYSLTISFDKKNNFVNFDLINRSDNTAVKANEVFLLPDIKIGYFLWFYFGGNKSAPKKMVTWLKLRSTN